MPPSDSVGTADPEFRVRKWGVYLFAQLRQGDLAQECAALAARRSTGCLAARFV